MSDIMIRDAGSADVDAVADLIATAFNPLAVARWLCDDPAERHRMMRGQFALVIAHAVRYGAIEVTADGTGAAVWMDQTAPVPEPPGYSAELAEITGTALRRFVQLDDAFAAHHPAKPHHHLAFLAVHPDAQSHGIGTALLEHHHDRLDRDRISGYLEASDTRSRDLYLRHGYTPLSELTLPDGGPSMYPMWRDPA